MLSCLLPIPKTPNKRVKHLISTLHHHHQKSSHPSVHHHHHHPPPMAALGTTIHLHQLNLVIQLPNPQPEILPTKKMSDEGPPYDSGEEDKVSATAGESPMEETTVVIGEDDNKTYNSSSSSSSMAKGLSYTISSIIRDFDSQAQLNSRSQDQLSSAIDRLTGEFDQLLADAPSPFIMQPATKLSSIRIRVSSLNVILKSIQHRVDIIDRLVSACLPQHRVDIIDRLVSACLPKGKACK